MKNQYFGDKNDFFKYDFALTLIEEIDNLDTFVFIPMLTKNDGSNDGKLISFDDSRRRSLGNFLKKCANNSKRNILNLRVFMKSHPDINYLPYKDDQYFENNERYRYFRDIESYMLEKAVVLIDPDNGFEVKSMDNKSGHKYLKFSELKMLYDKMDFSSVLMVYQHIPRVKRDEYFISINEQIYNHVHNDATICLSDNVIAFFLICKDKEIYNEISANTIWYTRNNNLIRKEFINQIKDNANLTEIDIQEPILEESDSKVIYQTRNSIDYECDHFLFKIVIDTYRFLKNIIQKK